MFQIFLPKYSEYLMNHPGIPEVNKICSWPILPISKASSLLQSKGPCSLQFASADTGNGRERLL